MAEVLFIKKTNLVREYQSETEGFKGKKYRLYAFGEDAFAVHEDDDFHKDYAEGNIKEVMLNVNAEAQLSLANYVTWTRAKAQKRHEAEFEAIGREFMLTNKSVEQLEDVA